MAKELAKLLRNKGLKNRDHVIKFNRLMVRGDQFENRIRMIDLLLVIIALFYSSTDIVYSLFSILAMMYYACLSTILVSNSYGCG
jgi:hypothetical protein